MADLPRGADSRPGEDGEVKSRSAEKRPSTESSEESAPIKKFSIGPKPKPLLNQKISFDLGSPSQNKLKPLPATGKTKAPIKMSLNPTQKKEKEAPPVVQKSALAAKIFNDSDDSGDEEMPPEAKMRMKNIGRDTPTASGPNSYGKGKQGFIDRHKIIEKQLKEEMEKVSGDNERPLK
ncbi:PEST proteolytic signal-containing nuclear protein [Biomphalaria glabrata]|uniref:PEST proteolytic signal-containing nuclear protein n=1 Tax=Biomphalaria glabrata TaxID=6526 RepID=A0A2C9KH15_BIOGL|nr:PEST proteolytic signal-containing nuclear protein-like [Biomphalaria glabrata]KAI8742719.1 PEST proteolytic signal-containing nuclear protein-like [Biomphalaria glabrata]KAI8772860.1 PEST proteolytic signal-containing nuclear protein [Biomphalaria glabrata]